MDDIICLRFILFSPPFFSGGDRSEAEVEKTEIEAEAETKAEVEAKGRNRDESKNYYSMQKTKTESDGPMEQRPALFSLSFCYDTVATVK